MNRGQRKPLKIGRTKNASLRSGSLLIEMVVATALLATIGILVFKSSMDIISPRQWVVHNNAATSYMTFEEALAARITFEELTDNNSEWPVYPATNTQTVEIGKLPGARPVSGTLIRTRIADPNNLPVSGGTGNTLTNPAKMETWLLESHLTYQISGETYVKSINTVRTQ